MPKLSGVKSLMASAFAGLALCVGCSQIPTEKQSAVDMRPQISFKIVNESTMGARVFVDNLDMGPIQDYQENQAALKVLPGKHIVSIVLHDRVVYEESIYVGHGMYRAIIVQ